MNKRLFPLDQTLFQTNIEPIISSFYNRSGRPPTVSHYQFFCALLYVLRTGIPWRDLPACYGRWHTIYTRFKRWTQNGWLQKLSDQLQSQVPELEDFAWIDSTTFKVHRHGAGALKKRPSIHWSGPEGH